MTGLRLTLQGRHLPIFEKHPFPWQRDQIPQAVAGMRCNYFVDGVLISHDTVCRLKDSRGRIITTSAAGSPALCYRLWDMYLYAMHAADGAPVPRIIQRYPAPWRKAHWETLARSDGITSIIDADGGGVMSWRNKQADSALYSALFDFSVYAHDIFKRTQQ
jgi:hypothetical protein